MKTLKVLIILMLPMIMLISSTIIHDGDTLTIEVKPKFTLLYTKVEGTIYNPVKSQCDGTPNITGDGSHFDVKKASSLRWIAVSQDMLYSPRRAKMINDPEDKRFKGHLEYGDTIWIKSKCKELNGWWVVKDAMNSKCTKSIDFLQTVGDQTLYNCNKLWSGSWQDIRIYRLRHVYYAQYQKMVNENLLSSLIRLYFKIIV